MSITLVQTNEHKGDLKLSIDDMPSLDLPPPASEPDRHLELYNYSQDSEPSTVRQPRVRFGGVTTHTIVEPEPSLNSRVIHAFEAAQNQTPAVDDEETSLFGCCCTGVICGMASATLYFSIKYFGLRGL
jgi:hypothetical protein